MRPDPTNAHEPLKWIFPFCLVPVRPKDGLAYLDWMKWGVLQYCIVRPGTTLAAVILEQLDLYCESSWNWRWGHVYVVTIASVSAAVAMYSLIQLYTTIRQDLKHCKPRLKLFTVISLVFLTFWQSTLLEGITSLDLVPDTEYLTARDITLGFSALLQTFEMMCLAFIHIQAFSYGPYKQLARRPESRSLHPDTRQTDLPVSARRRVVNLVRAFRFTRTTYRTHQADERVLERSFMRTGGYKGLPQDDKRPKARARPSIPGLRYSPFPTPPYDEQEDVSPLRARADDVVRNVDYVGPSAEYVASNAGYVVPSAEYVVPTVEYVGPSVEYVVPNAEYADLNVEYTPCPDAEYAPSPRPPPLAPAPPPKGAYIPARGPAWSGDGVITPPRTPVLMSPPGSSYPPQLASVIPSHTPTPDGPAPPVISTSRRIGSVYVGGTRGSEFFTPRPDPGPISPRSPVSPGSATTPVSLRTPISATSPRSPAPFTPRSPDPLMPRAKGSLRPDTHISPSSARVLAQTSPLFQQSFVDAQVPLSPVSPRLVRVSEEDPRLVRVSEEDTGLLRVSEEGTRPLAF
ncbi:unnamed protein product [Rhizoctonia solani]|uniref:Uncharacterized protein n=1 Tax=Rhizoctonia solani TaxID=456999 RepID=A0A8H3EAG5_9AGAM|nr:unnamed protein product [Rhizoctonia solani]